VIRDGGVHLFHDGPLTAMKCHPGVFSSLFFYCFLNKGKEEGEEERRYNVFSL
jgi:hypothetical protein